MWELIEKTLSSAPLEIVWSVMGGLATIGLLTAASKWVGQKAPASAEQEAAFRRDLIERNAVLEGEKKILDRQVIRLINLCERAARQCPGECADFLDDELKAFFAQEDKK